MVEVLDVPKKAAQAVRNSKNSEETLCTEPFQASSSFDQSLKQSYFSRRIDFGSHIES